MKKAIVLLTVCLVMASTNFAQTGTPQTTDTTTVHSKSTKKPMKMGTKKEWTLHRQAWIAAATNL